MKVSRIISVCFPLLVALGCGPSVSVSHDYDRTASFAALRSYDWLPQAPVETFFDARIKSAVDQQLATKGYTRQPGPVDFFVAYHVFARERLDIQDWGYGPGAGWGWGSRDIRVQNLTEGTLILDIVDAQTMRVVWRGYASGLLDPSASVDERDKRVNDAVAKLLAPFPSKQRYTAGR